MRWLAALVLAGASASPAWADEIALRYDSAAGCPDGIAFEVMVSQRLGYRPFADAAAKRAEVTLRGKRARVTIREGGEVVGERELRGDDCGELAAATALALAIAIDAEAVYAARAPQVQEAPEARVEVEPEVEPPAEIEREHEHEHEHGGVVRVYAAAGVVAAFGASPDTTAGATLHVGLRRGRASIDLEGRSDRSSHVAFGTGRVYAALTFGAIVPCYHRGRFAGCGILAVGALRGRGEDFVDASSVANTFAAGGARVTWELPVAERISARVHADLLGAFARTSLQVSGMDVWTLPPVSAAVGVSAVGHFR